MVRVLVAGLVLVAAVGCSSNNELSKGDDETLRNNLKRDLTPEELGQMGKAAPAAPPKKGD